MLHNNQIKIKKLSWNVNNIWAWVKNLGAGETAGLPFYPIFLLFPKYFLYFKTVTIFFIFHTHLSSNLALTSLLALRFRAGSLKASLLTADLSRLTSTEYLKIVQ